MVGAVSGVLAVFVVIAACGLSPGREPEEDAVIVVHFEPLDLTSNVGDAPLKIVLDARHESDPRIQAIIDSAFVRDATGVDLPFSVEADTTDGVVTSLTLAPSVFVGDWLSFGISKYIPEVEIRGHEFPVGGIGSRVSYGPSPTLSRLLACPPEDGIREVGIMFSEAVAFASGEHPVSVALDDSPCQVRDVSPDEAPLGRDFDCADTNAASNLVITVDQGAYSESGLPLALLDGRRTATFSYRLDADLDSDGCLRAGFQ